MALSKVSAVFQSDIRKVWDIVTTVENYTWRSDLGRTEILNEKQFVEYTKDGYTTTFTTTVFEPCMRWEFEMENSNMKGHWIGVFCERDGKTEVEFTEDVTVKKILMKPFAGVYLKKQQKRFISDLKKALLE